MKKLIKSIGSIHPVMDEKVRSYCKLSYPGHPKGCPMFGKRPECPPQAPIFYKHFNKDKPFTAIIVEFNLKNHAMNMKLRHPEWTDKQCRNPLYWQNGVRTVLKFQCKITIKSDEDYTLIPEAMGINVIETMKQIGIDIEFPVKDIVRKVAIIGTIL